MILYFKDFINFLNKRNIINTGVGIVVGTQVRTITDVIVRNLINPIVNKSLPKNIELEKVEVNFLGIKFKIGEIINKLLEFFLIMFLIYQIYRIHKEIEASKSIWNLFGLFQ
jgi:large-conductance mechanosensitive channel